MMGIEARASLCPARAPTLPNTRHRWEPRASATRPRPVSARRAVRSSVDPAGCAEALRAVRGQGAEVEELPARGQMLGPYPHPKDRDRNKFANCTSRGTRSCGMARSTRGKAILVNVPYPSPPGERGFPSLRHGEGHSSLQRKGPGRVCTPGCNAGRSAVQGARSAGAQGALNGTTRRQDPHRDRRRFRHRTRVRGALCRRGSERRARRRERGGGECTLASSLGARAAFQMLDVTREVDWEDAVATALSRWGHRRRRRERGGDRDGGRRRRALH